MSKIIGIDLGTTFSAIAELDDAGRPVIVRNSDGDNITPSVVSVTGPDQFVIGTEAKRGLDIDPATFGRFKREMGTDRTYEAMGATLTPTALSAIVLKKLKQATEALIGPIAEAVITIPANFANEAREATLAAARQSGLTVRHIINEPTAAALYFSQTAGADLGGVYAVYDLGGGTFDVSIIRVDGDAIDVLATEGVAKLGGDDFDERLRALIAQKYEAATGSALGPEDYTRNDAEEDKKSLSRRDKALTRVTGPGGRVNVTVERAEFEEAISALIAQTEILCETALEDAGVAASEIQAVILAGGSTRVPAVQASVERAFGQPPATFGNPDEAVALGAALYAGYRADKSNLNAVQQSAIAKIKVAEIASKYFGTLSVGMNVARGEPQLQNDILIEKGKQIPCSVTKTYFTVHEGQQGVECQVTESATPESDPRFVRVLETINLELPADRPAEQPIEVTFAYDENQTMSCAFKDVETGETRKIELNLAGDGGDDADDVARFIVE